ncbi:restriction endonuclease subunit S [Halomonas piscis]|uniref:Restriction endonuclease subunit S n=1 Tax=Halomonas piscis TaxID=3031727 RepID=A0ABY9YX89_9GAMM|nr:restriction endonuclease subunit S [Halomonas piscis]WNK19070.1 restriction endonuclease subunit S [Halomonas piscis]
MKFKEYAFRDLLTNIVDNRGRTCPTAEQGIPLIATNCIKNTRLYPVYEKLRYVAEDTYKNWFRGHPKPGDMIFVCKGSPGRVCWVPDPVPFCIAQDMVAIRADETKVYPRYLFALLRSEEVQNQILNMHVGSLIPHFKKGDFANLYLQIPEDMGYQHQVGDAYFSFCEKIESNHQINQTLEQMTQALFKSWFVDFEPVKAKATTLEAGGSDEDALFAAMEAVSGKTKDQLIKLSAEQPERYAELRATSELFPSAMQDSEMGDIPEGWNCLPLDTIAKYQNGLALQKYRPENEDDYLPVVKIAQLKKGFADGKEKASSNIKPDCIIDDGDVVFSWSGSLMVDTWCGGKAAMNQHLFKVTSTDYPKWIYYNFTRHHLEEFQRIAESKAVTMGHIKRQHLREALCAIPDNPLIEAAEQHLGLQLNKQINLRLEAKTLSKLRDTLLPELLSGDLTMSNVEEAQAESQDVVHV